MDEKASHWKNRKLLLTLLLSCGVYGISQGYNQDLPGFPHHFQSDNAKSDSSCDLHYFIVSTMDGQVSALNLHKRGEEMWALKVDSRPLYSSSLPKIKMVRDGKDMQLIPSLDGALYQFDGEKVEAIPMSAETLLSSTSRFSDDSMIVGSKELKSIGVDITTGQVLFTCDSSGCHHHTDAAEDGLVDGSNVLIVTRNTQVVRSVDIKSGQEKWNFSVGQHEARLSPNVQGPRIEDDDDLDDLNDDIPFFTHSKECPSDKVNMDDEEDESFLRLVVPEGRVVSLNKDDTNVVDWEFKCDSPIAKAWIYRNGKLEPMSLFDARHVPTLSMFSTDEQSDESAPKPLLYIGSHLKNLYIQPSPQMETILKSFPTNRIGHVLDPNMKIAWRPYQNTASSRTPIFGGNWDERNKLGQKDSATPDSKPSTSLIALHEQYPFDMGIFLYPEAKERKTYKKGSVMQIEDLRSATGNQYMSYLPVSFWMYWKEMALLISITLVLHLMMVKWFNFSILGIHRRNLSTGTNSVSTTGSSQEFHITDENIGMQRSSSSEETDYISRFSTDFECLHCLGKGGFGVVFEAVNKVDEQHYAVKRISLPRSDGAKEKVLREVKALAKLEHPGIVRYFNAWVESPPIGWQEEKDKSYPFSDLSTTNISPTPSSPTSQSYQVRSYRKTVREQAKVKKLQTLGKSNPDPKALWPDVVEEASLGVESSSESIVFSNDAPDIIKLPPAGSSGEFSVHSNLDDTNSDSWSACAKARNNIVSFGFDSVSSGHDSSKSYSKSSIPFSNYSSNSSVCFSNKAGSTDHELSGDSVVFESSSHNQSTGTESVIFADTSRKSVDKSHPAHALSKAGGDHKTDFTLSSINKEGRTEEKNQRDVSHNTKTQPKLFLYIQMQLYRKDTLKEWLNNNTLNRDRHSVLTIFDEITCAVDYVHKQGLMHRDLKPSNIFFSADGRIKIGDFGLVTALNVQHDQGMVAAVPSSDKHTAEVGTTLYMSPEQIANKPYDLKVDIFSLGLIFLELWIPFSTQMERIRTLQAAKRQSLPDRFLKELPSESGLVRKMTNEDPSQRPKTDDILDHLLFQDIAQVRVDHRSRKRTVSEKSS